MKKYAALTLAAMTPALAGCGYSSFADGGDTVQAVADAYKAEIQNTHTKDFASLATGTSITTNFANAGKLAVAKKTDNVKGEPNCAYVDIITSNPSTRYLWVFHTSGDSSWKQNVKVCVPS